MKRVQCEEDRFVHPIDKFNEQSSSKNETHPAETGRLSYFDFLSLVLVMLLGLATRGFEVGGVQRLTRKVLICANSLGMPSSQPYRPTSQSREVPTVYAQACIIVDPRAQQNSVHKAFRVRLL